MVCTGDSYLAIVRCTWLLRAGDLSYDATLPNEGGDDRWSNAL